MEQKMSEFSQYYIILALYLQESHEKLVVSQHSYAAYPIG